MGQNEEYGFAGLLDKLKNLCRPGSSIGGNQDFSNLNHLPPQEKELLVQAQTLLNRTHEVMADKQYYFDMTSKMQLKTDSRHLEQVLLKVSRNGMNEKRKKELEHAVLCLQTSLDGVIQFFTR